MDLERNQRARRWSDRLLPAVWTLAALLPLVGLFSLLLRSHLDPSLTNPRLHFVLFMTVGAFASGLAYAAGDSRGPARGRARAAAVPGVPLHRRVPAAARGRDHGRPLHGGARRFPRRDPGRAAAGVAAGLRIRVRRLQTVVRAARGPPPSGAAAHGDRRGGAVVRLDGAGAARAGVADQRGRRGQHVGGARGDLHRALPRRGGALPGGLPRRHEPAGGERRCVLRAAGRGDGRRRHDRRAQLARELVGVARADRAGVRHRVLRRPPRVARRAVPHALPLDDARAHPGGQRALLRPRRLHLLHDERRPRASPRRCSRPTTRWRRR